MEHLFKRKVYICQNTSENVRFDSTSGGVFTALATYVIARNGYVFGAEFDENWNVVHGYGRTEEDLTRFRGSKYVQSHLGDTFRQVRDLLKADEWVLFSGTPCQVEGLATFLGKSYEKLILMDIVCFSVSSPRVWRMFLDHLKKEKQLDLSAVKKIKFRDKTKYGYEYTLMTLYDKKGEVLYASGPESNPMLRSFVSNTSTRPSCYACSAKKVNRVSDFTAWDCYNVYKYRKDLDDNCGTSHLMVHSEKAQRILKELENSLRLVNVDLQTAVDSEPAMIQCAHPSDLRKDFFAQLEAGNDVFDDYFRDTVRVKMEHFLRVALSKTKLYSMIKRIIKG